MCQGLYGEYKRTAGTGSANQVWFSPSQIDISGARFLEYFRPHASVRFPLDKLYTSVAPTIFL